MERTGIVNTIGNTVHATTAKWLSGRRDSNPRPPAPKVWGDDLTDFDREEKCFQGSANTPETSGWIVNTLWGFGVGVGFLVAVSLPGFVAGLMGVLAIALIR